MKCLHCPVFFGGILDCTIPAHLKSSGDLRTPARPMLPCPSPNQISPLTAGCSHLPPTSNLVQQLDSKNPPQAFRNGNTGELFSRIPSGGKMEDSWTVGGFFLTPGGWLVRKQGRYVSWLARLCASSIACSPANEKGQWCLLSKAEK